MAEPIFEQIMAAIAVRLGTIAKPTYNNNIPGGAFRFTQEPATLEKLPAIGVTLNSESLANRLAYHDDQTLSIDVSIFAYHAANVSGSSETIIHSLIGDVKKAVATDEEWSGLAISTSVTGWNKFPVFEGMSFIGATVSLLVNYRHTIADTSVQN